MITLLILILALIFMNSFFVAAEFAIVKVRASQLELKVKLGNRPAIMAKHIVSHWMATWQPTVRNYVIRTVIYNKSKLLYSDS